MSLNSYNVWSGPGARGAWGRPEVRLKNFLEVAIRAATELLAKWLQAEQTA
jgi:hypothetical protein